MSRIKQFLVKHMACIVIAAVTVILCLVISIFIPKKPEFKLIFEHHSCAQPAVIPQHPFGQ